MSECGGLYAQMRVPTLDNMLSNKLECTVIFIHIVFGHRVRQAAHDEKMLSAKTNAAGPMDNLLCFVPCHFLQCFRIIDVHPRVRISVWIIEFPQIYRDVDPAISKTKIAVMIRYRDS